MQIPKIMIATPCYGGLIHEAYLRGLTSVVAELSGAGQPIHLATVINESLITRARNELVKNFMMSDCTHLFFIDADIKFEASDVFRLVSHDKDVVVASYPLKGQRWANIKGMKEINDPEEVRMKLIDHVVNFKFANEQDALNGRVPMEDGLVELHEGGTGFMCIKRHVIEKIIAANPHIKYEKEPRFLMNERDDGVRWAIFDTEIEDGKRYLSEDYLFCRRWQRLGGKILLDPYVVLTHYGTFGFVGAPVIAGEDPFIPQNQPQQGGFIGGR